MTPRQITLLRGSFEILARDPERTITIYLDRLHGLDAIGRPDSARRAAEAGILLRRLSGLIGRIEHVDALGPALFRWSRRHQSPEAADRLDAFGAAWLLTLEFVLGPSWSAELEGSWITFYGLILGHLRPSF